MTHRAPGLRGSGAPGLYCGVLLAGLAACAGPPVPPITGDDFTLRGIPVTSDSVELRLTFGEPDSIAFAENPFSSDAPLTIWHYDGFEVRFAGAAVPSGYTILEPGEQTARGLSVGDPADRAQELYGRAYVRNAPSWTWIDAADPTALRVIDVVVEQDTVRRIYLGRALE